MNTANLQLEGLYLAMAALTRTLVDKNLLTHDEVDTALRRAEAIAIGDDRMAEGLAPPQRDAVCFPIRLLRLANSGDPEASFSELARAVGESKPPYGDEV